jgi:hypothetical protein
VSRRHDRPNAVVWLLRNHPELKDSQLMRLVGTTKPTIAAIRDRTHWNSANLTPQDPVTLGLCSQTDLDAEVRKAAKRLERERKEQHKPLEKGGTLLPTSETIPGMGPQPEVEILAPRAAEEPRAETGAEEQARVLAKLRGWAAPDGRAARVVVAVIPAERSSEPGPRDYKHHPPTGPSRKGRACSAKPCFDKLSTGSVPDP